MIAIRRGASQQCQAVLVSHTVVLIVGPSRLSKLTARAMSVVSKAAVVITARGTRLSAVSNFPNKSVKYSSMK